MKILIITNTPHNMGPSNINFHCNNITQLFTPTYPTTSEKKEVPLIYPTLSDSITETIINILSWRFIEGATVVLHTDEILNDKNIHCIASVAHEKFGYKIYQTNETPIFENNTSFIKSIDKNLIPKILYKDNEIMIDSNQRTIIVGDIHDKTYLLDTLIAQHDTSETLWVLCGDMIDGEGNICDTLNYISHLDSDKFLLIEGNHEHNMRWLSAGFKPVPGMALSEKNYQYLTASHDTYHQQNIESMKKLLSRVYSHILLKRGDNNYLICHGGISRHVDISDKHRWCIADRTFIHGTSHPYNTSIGKHTYTVTDANLKPFQIIGHRNDQDNNNFSPIDFGNNVYLLELSALAISHLLAQA